MVRLLAYMVVHACVYAWILYIVILDDRKRSDGVYEPSSAHIFVYYPAKICGVRPFGDLPENRSLAKSNGRLYDAPDFVSSLFAVATARCHDEARIYRSLRERSAAMTNELPKASYE